jgi:hypothetical protein
MNDSRDPFHLTLLALLITVACLPLLHQGAMTGHSLHYNLAWAEGFGAQLRGGEPYPRWLVDGNAGGGSPAFFFYAPLPYYLTTLPQLFCPGCAAPVRLAQGEWLILLLAGAAFYRFARRAAPPAAALGGALLYTLLPYHFTIDLLERQALGEFAAFIWPPLLLLAVERVAARACGGAAGLALAWAGLLFTHLPSALLFAPFLGGRLLWLAWARRSWGVALRGAAGIGGG